MNFGFQSAEPGEHAHERLIYGLGSHERAKRRESPQENPTMIKQTIVVEHIRIESAKPFADVRAALERSVFDLDPAL